MTFGAGGFGVYLGWFAKDWREDHRFREDLPMSALTNRGEARERALAVFSAALDRIIPPDELMPLKGSKFVDFEDQVEEVAQAVLPTLLEERAALDVNAQAAFGGRCPYCGSERVYLEKEAKQAERFSRHGPVVIQEQQARCRACDGSFSPSGSGLESAGGGSADLAGGPAFGSRGHDAAVRQGGGGLERGLGDWSGWQTGSTLGSGAGTTGGESANGGSAGPRAGLASGVSGERTGVAGHRDGRRSRPNPRKTRGKREPLA